MSLSEKDRKKIMGEKLTSLLKSHRMKQKDFAEIIDTSPTDVSLWVNGHRFIPTYKLHKICNLFKVPLSYFEDSEETDQWVNLGAKIVNIRNEKNITYRDLATKTGIRPLRLSKIESGDVSPSQEEFDTIAEALEISVSDLQIDFELKVDTIERLLKEMNLPDNYIQGLIEDIKLELYK